MKEPSISVLKKYLVAMNKSKAKYMTSEKLSRLVGVYPEIISEQLSYFEPTLLMDTDFNLLELVPAIKQHIIDVENKKTPVVRTDVVTKKNLDEYESILDFVYKKMSLGGIVDKSTILSDKDLRILKRLIQEEQARRKKK